MTKWLIILVSIMVVLLILFMGIITGIVINSYEPWPEYTVPITAEQGIEYLERSRASHQFYIDHPEWLQQGFVSVEFQYEMVERYDQLIDLLRRLD